MDYENFLKLIKRAYFGHLCK